MEQQAMRDRILEAAERRVRAAGFAEMSFRDVAEDVGIKSASVHYHFKTKAELGEALVQAYTDRFAASLQTIDQSDPDRAFREFVGLYNRALVVDESICLCAIMGAEAIGLPAHVNEKTSAFFRMNVDWLSGLFSVHSGRDHAGLARLVVAALEGAIIVASASRNRDLFQGVADELCALVASRIRKGG